jgi:hypothetical protein
LQALQRYGPSRIVEQHRESAQNETAFAGFKLGRHARQKSRQDAIWPHTDHAVVPSGHSDIRNVRRAAWKYALIRGLHVSMRAYNRRNPAVQVKAQGLLLRGGLCVKVDQHKRGVYFFQQGVSAPEGAIDGRHKNPPLEVQNREALPLLFQRQSPPARTERRIVGRPEERHLLGQSRNELLLVPYVIAAGKAIEPHPHHLVQDFGRETETAGPVFTVGQDEVEGALLLFYLRQEFLHRLPSRLSHNVAEK